MVKRKNTNNGQEKKEKQWPRIKRINNGQEKKDKQWSREKG
jgi:hypothetical protein